MKKEYRKNKFVRIAVIVLMFLVTLGLGFGVYAYWASGVEAPTDDSLNITITTGEGQKAETKIVGVSLQENYSEQTLVPENRSTSNDEIEKATFTFNIKWEEIDDQDLIRNEDDKPTGKLTVVVSNIQIDGGTDYINLVNITPSNTDFDIVLDGDAVEVTLTLTLTEPSSYTEYNGVADKDITFDITFSIDQINP